MQAITERSSTSFLIFLKIALKDNLVSPRLAKLLELSVQLVQATPDFTILIHTTPSIANARQASRNRPGEVIPSTLNEKLLLDHYGALQAHEFEHKVRQKKK